MDTLVSRKKNYNEKITNVCFDVDDANNCFCLSYCFRVEVRLRSTVTISSDILLSQSWTNDCFSAISDPCRCFSSRMSFSSWSFVASIPMREICTTRYSFSATARVLWSSAYIFSISSIWASRSFCFASAKASGA